MKCPHCEKSLVMSERSGIEIDYCPECRGVWLDRGELDKILERNRKEAAAPLYHEASREERPYRDEYARKPYKRRKSFLEELFD